MAGTQITMKHVRDYFNTDTLRPVTMTEFSEFWKACSNDEKEYFKSAVGEILA